MEMNQWIANAMRKWFVVATIFVALWASPCFAQQSIFANRAAFAIFMVNGAQCLNLVAVGDSITVGFGATNPHPANISTALSTISSNQGVNGAGWNYDFGGGNLTARAATAVDPTLGGCNSPFLILFAGTNDIVLGGSTGAQTYAYFQTYITARLSAGWLPQEIIVATMLPRSDASETQRTNYNNLLISGAATYGYTLARLDQDSNIGCAGCASNLTYYQSGGISGAATYGYTLARLD
jgi:lysophospholipase L1-like esterase